ncbi:uncharacterized protein LOC115391124 isoform X1 [Salarias fasciatus]|uniref:uncharacterized protein LOC115391124 isoform X1 n=1 Tax=Salarias fasciatus TaxID=181472 RepID=UPI0011766097|nr:uncharacterized protein LOC115391124 isoform X1 [Salarias fasciatus]
MLVALFVLTLGLFCYSQGNSESVLGIPQLYGPSEALLRQVVDFVCELQKYPENETIQLRVYKMGHHEKLLGEYTYQPDEVASIPMMITDYHEGFLECVAKPLNASSSNITATVSDPHYLKVIVPVKNAEIEYSGPMELFEEDILELRCLLEAGTHVSYQWLLNGRLLSPSPRHHFAEDRLRIFRTTSGDSGFYTCIASNTFNNTEVFTSNSTEMEITVKVLASDPDISFVVLKEIQNYSALVTCQSARGSLPITFSLYNSTELVSSVTAEKKNATFKVPLDLRQPPDRLECQANNSDPIAHSQWLPLRVVPVKGPVTMLYDQDIGENYVVIGLKMYCRASEGSHPRYHWFLNKTRLHDRGSFYRVDDQPPQQSILHLSVRASSSAGTYHCKVSDSFDNANAVGSNRKYVDREVLNRLPILVVVIVFGSFAILIMLVSVCCIFGVIYRRRVYGEKSLLTLEMERLAAYEGELESLAYTEAGDVAETASQDNFDEVSEASADEWPQTEELQDEPL